MIWLVLGALVVPVAVTAWIFFAFAEEIEHFVTHWRL